MIKVAMIGAGSVVFSRNLTGDILSYPEFRNATLSYMDIDPGPAGGGRQPLPQNGRGAGGKPDNRGGRRSPPGAARRGFRHQHGADRRVRFDARRFRDSAQIRTALHHRRHHRAGRTVPRTAHLSHAQRTLPRHDRALPQRPAAELFQPHVDEHADDLPHQRPVGRRPVPQRAGHVRSTDAIHRREAAGRRVHLRRHQPHGVLSEAGKKRSGPLSATVRGDERSKNIRS